MKKSFVALVLFVVGVMANVVVAQSQPTPDMGKHIKKEVQYAILLMDNGMVKQSIHFYIGDINSKLSGISRKSITRPRVNEPLQPINLHP